MASAVRHGWRFGTRVTRTFLSNKGVLLAGAVGYNALLSIIPLIAITLVVLSHFWDDETVLRLLVARLRPLAPGLAPAAHQSISSFLANRQMVGGGGLVMLFLVSSVAFRMLEDAMAIIFRRPRRLRPRSRWVSLLIQFGYVPLVGIGLILLTGMSVLAGALDDGTVLGFRWFAPFAGVLSAALGLTSFVASVGLLTSFYRIMPVVKVPVRLAAIGALVAAVLWALVSQGVAYFFDHLSLVPVLYGSLGGVIVLLVSLEIFSGVLLYSAQIVAEIDRSWRAGRRWWEPAPEAPALSLDLS